MPLKIDRGTYLHIVGATGPVIDRFTAGEGVDKGFLVPANITMLKWHPDSPKTYWRKDDFEVNDGLYTYTGSKKKGDPGLYNMAIVRHKLRNEYIIDSVAIMVEDELNILVLVDRLEHGLFLKKEIERDTGAGVIFIRGENDSKERDAAIDALKSGRIQVLIATSIFDEGMDVPQIDGIVFAGGQKAQHRYLQRLGRGMRPHKGKRGLEVVDFYDTHSRVMWKHAKEREKAYRSDPDAYKLIIEEVGGAV